MYKVHTGYTLNGHNKWARFETLESASKFCNAVWHKNGIILTIIKEA